MKTPGSSALIRVFSYCSGVYQWLRERSVRLKLSSQAAWSQPIWSRIERYVVLAFAVLSSPLTSCFSAGTPAEAQPEPDLVVVAKLVAIEPARGCGMFHFAEVAEYIEITVFEGVWSSDRLRVVHGCTELPRSQYASRAGTLERFTVGDYHRLELSMHDIYKTGRRLKTEDNASVADYYALRVDLAPTPSIRVEPTAGTVANPRNTLTTAATNRLVGATYDAAGNLIDWTGTEYQYDRFNQMVRMTTLGGEDWAYVYTADDERIWSYNLPANTSNWTLRDLSGQVLREYVNENGTWTLGTDYIRRDGQLLAAETRLGRRHFHLDHLGTPRSGVSTAW